MGLGSQDAANRKTVAKASGVKGDWKDKLTTIAEFEQMLTQIQTHATSTAYTEEKIMQLKAIISLKRQWPDSEFCVHCHICKKELYAKNVDNLTFREYHTAACKPNCQNQKSQT